MDKRVGHIIVLLFITWICWNCDNHKSTTDYSSNDFKLWADTIIYEVLIHNPDSLNEWENSKLKYVQQKKIVNNLFESIYSGKKKAYHYYSHDPMSIDEIKELENSDNFSRDRVGKLQFTETWYFNKQSVLINKEIHSILLAYEIYDDANNLRGYKAAFYLKDFK